MPKRFTLAEAQRLIPEVGRLLREAVERKSEFDEAEGQFQQFTRRATQMGGMLVDRNRALQLRNARDAALGNLRKSVEDVQQLGCIVKDLDMGLVDFPATFRGEEVYLCWKLGEEEIAFWHGVDEGFRGRKAIDRDFLTHHKGDPAN